MIDLPDINIVADEILRPRALESAKQLLDVRADPSRISRTQIRYLLRVARDKPLQVADFAQHQAEKAENKDPDNTYHAADFWRAVKSLIEQPANAANRWCLYGEACELNSPEQQTILALPKQGLTIEQRQTKNRVKKTVKELRDKWLTTFAPLFFTYVCAEYLQHFQD